MDCRGAARTACRRVAGGGCARGPLDPPGPPASTAGVLRPGTPISALPFTISQAGSYYLTTNLSGSAGSNGITVQSNDVTIDLGGFTLGAAPGAASAITESANSPGWFHWTIRNGTIDGWQRGISASQTSDSHFSDLIINGATQQGIFAGGAIMIDHVTSHGNGGWGFLLGAAAQISDCFVDGSSVAILISTADQSTIARCSTVGGDTAIKAGPASRIDAVDVRFAGRTGINLEIGGSVANSSVAGTGTANQTNVGIWAHGNASIANDLVDTVVGPSAGYAIVAAGNSNRIAGNQIEHATYGVLFDVGSANNIAYQNVLRDIPNVIVDLGSNQWQPAVGVMSGPNAWANIAY